MQTTEGICMRSFCLQEIATKYLVQITPYHVKAKGKKKTRALNNVAFESNMGDDQASICIDYKCA